MNGNTDTLTCIRKILTLQPDINKANGCITLFIMYTHDLTVNSAGSMLQPVNTLCINSYTSMINHFHF